MPWQSEVRQQCVMTQPYQETIYDGYKYRTKVLSI